VLPAGTVKLKTAAELVPELETAAVPVEVVPTLTVAAAPAAPVGPVAPIGPVLPAAPAAPAAPVGPAGPAAPGAPAGPAGPAGPVVPETLADTLPLVSVCQATLLEPDGAAGVVFEKLKLMMRSP